MSYRTNPLDDVKVAAPCPADWDSMVGGERVRFCGQCQLNVYNLSGMSRRKAEALVSSTEGRLCVRFYRRADGSVLTRDCPVGLRALKRRASRLARATLSAALGFLSGVGLNLAWSQGGPLERLTMGAVAVGEPVVTIEPPSVPPGIKEHPFQGEMVVGQLAFPIEQRGEGSRSGKAKRLRAGK